MISETYVSSTVSLLINLTKVIHPSTTKVNMGKNIEPWVCPKCSAMCRRPKCWNCGFSK